MRRKLKFGLPIPVAAVVVAVAMLFSGPGGSVGAQIGQHSTMEQRLNQIIGVLQNPGPNGCGAAGAAIDSGMEILYGGLRPLPSKDEPEQTEQAHQEVSAAEQRFAEALQGFATGGSDCGDEKGRALDLKLFIEQMNEVAEAVGQVTRQCGEGDRADQPPCNELHPLFDENTGREIPVQSHIRSITPGYEVKLRSPFVPPWFGNSWEETAKVVDPIPPNSCGAVVKETRGLALRVHFDRIILVTDPWVGTFGVPRGTRVPIWRLEWVPTEYVKTWTLCNRRGRNLVVRDVQRVKQDIPVNFLWRFYPAA